MSYKYNQNSLHFLKYKWKELHHWAIYNYVYTETTNFDRLHRQKLLFVSK